MEFNNYKTLLPEIADLLNVSLSSLEQYPPDIQMILCSTYVNTYKSDDISIKQALGQIIQLNTETQSEIEKSANNLSKTLSSDRLLAEKTQQSQKEDYEIQKSAQKTKSLLSREQIIKNSKIIAEKYSSRGHKQSIEIETEQIIKKQSGES